MLQVKELSNLLKTNLEKGIGGDDADLHARRNAFGSNTYPRKKGRSFWVSCSVYVRRYLNVLCIHTKLLNLLIEDGNYVLMVCFIVLSPNFGSTQMFLWEAWQDLTLIILIIAAVASLVLGIKTEVSWRKHINFNN